MTDEGLQQVGNLAEGREQPRLRRGERQVVDEQGQDGGKVGEKRSFGEKVFSTFHLRVSRFMKPGKLKITNLKRVVLCITKN